MTAEPVQVLVTIHPEELADGTNWRTAVMGALLRDGQLTVMADYTCEIVTGQPHGEAKAHREAAVLALENARQAATYAATHDDAIEAQTHSLAAIAHALLALGERP